MSDDPSSSRFSRRSGWRLTPNALHTATERHRACGRALLDLTRTNPSEVGLPWEDLDGLRQALAPVAVGNYRPEPFGEPAARAALAAFLSEPPLDPEHLCLTASTSEAYAFLFKLLADPGDAIAVPTPSYPLFDDLAGLEGLALRPYALHHDGEWHIDFGALDAALKPTAGGRATRAVVVLNPNHPTGHFLSLDERASVLQRCSRAGAALISDEVFLAHALGGGQPAPRSAGASTNVLTFTLGGLSKLACLPQLKLGWIAASGPAPLLETALARLELIADTYLGVSTPAQLALPYVLGRVDRMIASVHARTSANANRLHALADRRLEVSIPAIEGGWTGLVRLPRIRSSEGWALHFLETADVLVQPGYFYGLLPDAYVVVSLITPEAEFDAALSALAATLGSAN